MIHTRLNLRNGDLMRWLLNWSASWKWKLKIRKTRTMKDEFTGDEFDDGWIEIMFAHLDFFIIKKLIYRSLI